MIRRLPIRFGLLVVEEQKKTHKKKSHIHSAQQQVHISLGTILLLRQPLNGVLATGNYPLSCHLTCIHLTCGFIPFRAAVRGSGVWSIATLTYSSIMLDVYLPLVSLSLTFSSVGVTTYKH